MFDIYTEIERYLRDIKREIPYLPETELEKLIDRLERIKKDIEKIENVVVKALEVHRQLRELELEEERLVTEEEIRKV